MTEVWKDIEGYEGLYQVSNLGRVKSLPKKTKNQYSYKEIMLKQNKDKDGYLIVNLTKNKKGKTYKVHRLVAFAFIPKIKNKEIINHKDGNKQNNSVDNLEWCTNRENIIHAFKNNLIKIKKGKENPVCKKVILKRNNEKLEFYSLKEASKYLGVGSNAICNCLKKRSRTCKGYEVNYG